MEGRDGEKNWMRVIGRRREKGRAKEERGERTRWRVETERRRGKGERAREADGGAEERRRDGVKRRLTSRREKRISPSLSFKGCNVL